MKRVIALGLLALVMLLGCTENPVPGGSARDDAGRPVPTASGGGQDYIVVEKTIYRGTGSGKAGYYVTIILFGTERETAVTFPCYQSATLGKVLPLDCR